MAVSTAVIASTNGYSKPASARTITIGSTGNWYFYINPNIIYDLTSIYATNSLADESQVLVEHTIFNPAGCTSPSRYVLDSTTGNYDQVIDALEIFGVGGIPVVNTDFGIGGPAQGGLQFYVSSSTCVANSPKIVRIRYLPAVLGLSIFGFSGAPTESTTWQIISPHSCYPTSRRAIIALYQTVCTFT